MDKIDFRQYPLLFVCACNNLSLGNSIEHSYDGTFLICNGCGERYLLDHNGNTYRKQEIEKTERIMNFHKMAAASYEKRIAEMKKGNK